MSVRTIGLQKGIDGVGPLVVKRPALFHVLLSNDGLTRTALASTALVCTCRPLPGCSAYAHLEYGTLVGVFPEYKAHPERRIYALYPQNCYLSTRIRLINDWLSDAIAEFYWY